MTTDTGNSINTLLSQTSAASRRQANQAENDRLQELDIDEFLKLMMAELQNQDPLNPLDNAQMIQQIGEIRSIASTDKLSNTLQAVQLGQALSSASSLIGRTIKGLGEDNKEVAGQVDRVTVVNGIPKLHIGAKELQLGSVREILPTT